MQLLVKKTAMRLGRVRRFHRCWRIQRTSYFSMVTRELGVWSVVAYWLVKQSQVMYMVACRLRSALYFRERLES